MPRVHATFQLAKVCLHLCDFKTQKCILIAFKAPNLGAFLLPLIIYDILLSFKGHYILLNFNFTKTFFK